MWAEIIASRDDLARLLRQAFPLTIHLRDPGSDQTLELTDLASVSLVADVGLRVECKARVRWPVLGIDVPVVLKSLTAVLLPSIGKSAEGDTLVFKLELEHADFSALPNLLDSKLKDAINKRLGEDDAALSWNFSRDLTYSAPLPATLEPLERFALKPAWGRVRITEEAVVYAFSFHTALVRNGESAPTEFEGRTAPATRPPVDARALAKARRDSPLVTQLLRAGAFGIGVGAAYSVLRASFEPRS